MSALSLVFDWTVAATLRASVMVLVVLLVQRLLRNRLSPKWKYALWLPVLATILIPAQPFLPAWAHLDFDQEGTSPRNTLSASAPSLDIGGESTVSQQSESVDAVPGSVAISSALDGSTVDAEMQSASLKTNEKPDMSTAEGSPALKSVPPQEPPWNWKALICGAWLFGVVGLGFGVMVSYVITLDRIRRLALPVERSILNKVESLGSELGLRRAPQVWLSPAVKTPAVCGVLRPVLLLNKAFCSQFSREESHFVLKHELMHLRRGDVLRNNLLCLLLALHWFNPLLWYAFFRIRADNEAACDEDVLRNESQERRVVYGMTLLKMETAFPEPGLYLGFIGMLQRKHSIRERIQFITNPMSMRASMKLLVVICVVTCAILGVAKAVEHQEESETPPESRTSTSSQEPQTEDQQATSAFNFRKLASFPTRESDAFTRALVDVSFEQKAVISRNHIRSGGEDISRDRIAAYMWSLDPNDPKRTRLPDSTTFGFVPNSNLGYQVSWWGGVQFWDTQTHTRSGEDIAHALREDTTIGPAISPNGKIMVTRSQMDHLRFWDIPSRKPITPEIEQPAVLYGLSFSPGGEYFFSKTGKYLSIWLPQTGELAAGPFRHDIYSYAYLPKTNRFVTFENNDVQEDFWNCRMILRSGEAFTQVARLSLPGRVRKADWIDDEHLLVLADDKDPDARGRYPFRQKLAYLVTFATDKPKVQEIMWSEWTMGSHVAPDGKHFIITTRDETSCWKVGEKEPIWTKRGDQVVSFGDDWVLFREEAAVAYSLADGRELWRREDVQTCRVGGSHIWICDENEMELWRVDPASAQKPTQAVENSDRP